MDLQNPAPEDLLCDESFLRYCWGENQTDITYWEYWIQERPERQAVAERARRLFDMLTAGQRSRPAQLAALKDAVARREQFAALMSNRPAPARVVKFKGKKILRYAAAVAVLITAGALTYFQYTKKPSWSLTRYEYHTPAGSRQTIMLPDGSVVMLNASSHLYIGKDLRTVTLSGEAFFDIRHDAVHPFLVHTKDYNIRVLGTSFNVRAYAGARRTETDLITGKVEIIPATQEKVVLQPNEKFILAPEATAPVKGTIAHLEVDTLTHHATETSWARNRMDVHDETLAAIAQKLEAWYGIRIIFSSEKAKQYRYTASFNDETVFRALQYLKQSYPFSYKVEGDLIIISES